MFTEVVPMHNFVAVRRLVYRKPADLLPGEKPADMAVDIFIECETTPGWAGYWHARKVMTREFGEGFAGSLAHSSKWIDKLDREWLTAYRDSCYAQHESTGEHQFVPIPNPAPNIDQNVNAFHTTVNPNSDKFTNDVVGFLAGEGFTSPFTAVSRFVDRLKTYLNEGK